MSPSRAWALFVVVVTAAYGLVPLLADRGFYQQSDTAVQFAPTWYHLGHLVRAGHWPPTLDPGAWVGGNYAAEALFGVYNPLNVLVWLGVSFAPDLVVAVVVVKCLVLVALALGIYLLAREYGALPAAAAVPAIAVPLSGFTHYFDAAAWPSGLMAFAYAPWVWWAFRRVLHGRSRPYVAVIVGALAVTQGNPYGTLAVVVIGCGVVVEALACGDRDGATRILGSGVCVAAFLPLVYLPLMANASLASRAGGPLISDTGRLSASWLDLLGAGNPRFVPAIEAGHSANHEPVVYAVWFLLPLLPWLRWAELRRRARELQALVVVGLIYLVVLLGPSEIWFFRWPLRVFEYLLVALGVAFAVVLSQGLKRDRVPARLAASAALVGAAALLELARSAPGAGTGAIAGAALVAVLGAVVLVVHLRGPASLAPLAVVLVLGCGVVLGVQSHSLSMNRNLRVWPLTSDVSTLQDRFATYQGRVMQFADMHRFQDTSATSLLGPADHVLLPGSMPQVAGLAAVNSYTGMGYRPFRDALCLHYDGSADACGYQALWESPVPGGPPLVDLMKLDTVVAARDIAAQATPTVGWTATDRGEVVVLRRPAPTSYAGSRLSWAAPGIEVLSAQSQGVDRDTVKIGSAPAGGQMVFAMLDWAGYSATLNGKPVPLGRGPAGLATVDLPPSGTGTLVVAYRAPGQTVGALAALAGLLGGVALTRWRKRSD